MAGSGLSGRLICQVVAVSLLAVLLACSSGPSAPAPTAAPAGGQAVELASLRQQVVAQETRLAALEARLPQETRVASLETRVAVIPTAVPTRPAPPTPTVVPPAAGLATDGTTKGLASAKVTITEYLDYL